MGLATGLYRMGDASRSRKLVESVKRQEDEAAAQREMMHRQVELLDYIARAMHQIEINTRRSADLLQQMKDESD